MNSKPFAFSNLRDPRRALAGLTCAWLALSGGTAYAETAAAPAAPAATPNSYTVTLKQLGRNYPMTLRGVDSTDSVSFKETPNKLLISRKWAA
nr:cellulose biosynthesis cyclic di-GMP-binding regulatory protein BcsB [Pseudomonas sp. FSL R10-2398]